MGYLSLFLLVEACIHKNCNYQDDANDQLLEQRLNIEDDHHLNHGYFIYFPNPYQ